MDIGDGGATNIILQKDPQQRQGQQMAQHHRQQPPPLPPSPAPPPSAVTARLSPNSVFVRRYCPETDHADVVHICRNVCE
jgi:hypothetical protein